MIVLKQKSNDKHFFTSLVAMEKTLTEVPIVDVENGWERNFTGWKVHFKLQLLCHKNMHCVFLLYIDHSKGKTACMTTPWGVLLNNRLMGMIRWIEWHFHDRVDYDGVAFWTELIYKKGVAHFHNFFHDSKLYSQNFSCRISKLNQVKLPEAKLSHLCIFYLQNNGVRIFRCYLYQCYGYPLG